MSKYNEYKQLKNVFDDFTSKLSTNSTRKVSFVDNTPEMNRNVE
jgi:hypothetical protein